MASKRVLYNLKEGYLPSDQELINIQSELSDEKRAELVRKISLGSGCDPLKVDALPLCSWFPIDDNLWVNNTRYGTFISKWYLTLNSKKISYENN